MRPDQHLLIALLNDNDGEVRAAALRFAHNLNQPLAQYRKVLIATSASRAFREHLGAVLRALGKQAGNLLDEVLDLCEHWYADDGVSVVLSSHVLAELERVADYLILLSRGRVKWLATSTVCSPAIAC